MQQESEISTDNLLLMIENEEDISQNWEQLSRYMNAPSFCEYLYRLVSERSINIRELGVKTLLSRSFTYQIFSGDRIPGRDIILRIAVAVGATVDETQRLLKLADRGALYSKVKRDSAIIYALSNNYSLYETDELLVKLGQRSLI